MQEMSLVMNLLVLHVHVLKGVLVEKLHQRTWK